MALPQPIESPASDYFLRRAIQQLFYSFGTEGPFIKPGSTDMYAFGRRMLKDGTVGPYNWALSMYKSTDGGATFSLLDDAGAVNTNTNPSSVVVDGVTITFPNQWAVGSQRQCSPTFWLLYGSSFAATAPHVMDNFDTSIVSFDMAAELWSAPVSGGPLASFVNAQMTVLSDGTVVVVSVLNPLQGVDGTEQIVSLQTYNSGSGWGPSVLVYHYPNLDLQPPPIWSTDVVLLGVIPDATDKVHFFYGVSQSGVGPDNTDVFYVNWSAGGGVSARQLVANLDLSETHGWPNGVAVYDQANDRVLLPVMDQPALSFVPTLLPNNLCLITVPNASGASPVASIEGIADIGRSSPGGPYTEEWASPTVVVHDSEYTVGVLRLSFPETEPVALQILLFSRPDSGGPWTGPDASYLSTDSSSYNFKIPSGSGTVEPGPTGPVRFLNTKLGLATPVMGVGYKDFSGPIEGDSSVYFYISDLISSPNPCGAAITLACPVLPPSFGVPYSQPLVETGGTAPFTFAIIGGALPAGLSLNTSTGVISGTVTSFDPYSYTAQVTDVNGLTAQTTCTGAFGPPQPPAPVVCIPNPVSTYTVDLKSYNEPKELNGS